jgi:isoleucyl-tRNA synthetase
VHWCTTHQTALAEAEVEYADHASPSIFVRFPGRAGQPALEAILGKSPAALVIWTTTPWTLAANLAIVANPETAYVAIPVERAGQPREYLIVARELADGFLAACGLARRRRKPGSSCQATSCARCAGCATSIPSSPRPSRTRISA